MQIDETGGDHQAGGVELLHRTGAGRLRHGGVANGHDPSVAHGDITGASRPPSAVHDRAAPYHQYRRAPSHGRNGDIEVGMLKMLPTGPAAVNVGGHGAGEELTPLRPSPDLTRTPQEGR